MWFALNVLVSWNYPSTHLDNSHNLVHKKGKIDELCSLFVRFFCLSSETMKRVAFVCLEPFKLLDLVGPLQVFSDANAYLPEDEKYETIVLSSEAGAKLTDTVLSPDTQALSEAPDIPFDTTLVIGNENSGRSIEDRKTVTSAAQNSKRVGSVCIGAFALARVNMLNGLRAVTHWKYCDLLAQSFPEIRVEKDPIYIREGAIWTSGGVTSAIDMALAMVAEDHGRKVALDVAREMVVYMMRPGGQSQFSTSLKNQLSEADGQFRELASWIRENVTLDLTVDTLAKHCRMSSRTFTRRFHASFRCTPAKFVEMCRLEAAKDLLEETEMPIKTIAAKSGFLEAERLRRSFYRNLGISPVDYRKRFSVMEH